MKRISLAVALLALCIAAGACSKPARKPAAPEPPDVKIIVMEKVLAGTPERPGTTMKVIIPAAKSSADVKSALKAQFGSVRKDDPALKAVIIWAYTKRDELNGPNYTLGKLEWSEDGNNFVGNNALPQNPLIESTIP